MPQATHHKQNSWSRVSSISNHATSVGGRNVSTVGKAKNLSILNAYKHASWAHFFDWRPSGVTGSEHLNQPYFLSTKELSTEIHSKSVSYMIKGYERGKLISTIDCCLGRNHECRTACLLRGTLQNHFFYIFLTILVKWNAYADGIHIQILVLEIIESSYMHEYYNYSTDIHEYH